MKTFAYVRVTAPEFDKSLIGFDHAFVNAESMAKAYKIAFGAEPLMKGYVMLNDYVFEAKP